MHVKLPLFIGALLLSDFSDGMFQQDVQHATDVSNVSSITSPKRQRQKFLPEEDAKLRALVEELGSNDWEKVAARMPGRNARQCRERWNYYVNPVFNTTDPWTIEEEEIAWNAYQEFGTRWGKIGQSLPHRSIASIKNHIQARLGRKKPQNNQQQASSPIGAPPPPPPPQSAPVLQPLPSSSLGQPQATSILSSFPPAQPAPPSMLPPPPLIENGTNNSLFQFSFQPHDQKDLSFFGINDWGQGNFWNEGDLF